MEESAGVSDTGEGLCYKQRLEKFTGGEVVLMQWCPTMDLLAIAMADHSVSLCRSKENCADYYILIICR